MRIRASPSSSSSAKHASACTSPSSHSSNNNNNSSVSSSNSTPSISSASSSTATTTRCEGLTMLVKAAAFSTTGSVVGVPYVQRRIIIRRRKRSQASIFDFDFSTMLMNQKFNDGFVKKDEVGKEALLVGCKRQRKKAMGLHPQQPRKRPRRCPRSTLDESG